jgi:hypothetical protein
MSLAMRYVFTNSGSSRWMPPPGIPTGSKESGTFNVNSVPLPSSLKNSRHNLPAIFDGVNGVGDNVHNHLVEFFCKARQMFIEP